MKIALVIASIYFALSIITGATLLFTGIASFGSGFLLTALWFGGLCLVIRKDWR